MSLRAYAPAGIGNFAAGFDILGAALAPLDGSRWGDCVAAEAAAPGEPPSLTVGGPYAAQLPSDPRDNLVLATAAFFDEAMTSKTGTHPPPLAFHLDKNLPCASGLGSSASSVAATLAACQAMAGEPLERAELFAVAGRAEALAAGGSAHLDNVVPALIGGLQLLVPGPAGTLEARQLPWPAGLSLVVVSPAFALPTARSRRALPAEVPLGTAVAFAQNLAAFVAACIGGDLGLLRRCLRDLLAEPYRGPLVPGFAAAQQAALDAGALGCTLSGSGPALFAVVEGEERGPAVAAALQAELSRAGLAATARLCTVSPRGAELLP